MSTSDSSGGGVTAPSPAFSPEEFAAEIARLANEMFASPPAPPLAAPTPMAGPVVPPNPGPSALAVGAGGLSTAATAPPVPGFLHTPPLAASPPPKESDLRNGLSLGAELLGIQPVAAAGNALPAEPNAEAPYFLALAGLPGVTQNPPASSASAIPTSAVPRPAVPTSGVPSSAIPTSASPTSGGPTPGIPTSAIPAGAMSSPGTSVPSAAPGVSGPSGAPSSSGVSGVSGAPGLSGASGLELPAYFDPVLSDFRADTSSFGEASSVGAGGGLFDPYAVKRDFPILNERVHGKPLVWLDNAATTQKPRSVIERLTYYYEHENSNIHRAAHALAARATDAYEGARDKTRRFLNAPAVENIVFVRGATEAINLIAQTYGRRHVNAGDEIVVTWLEHHANIVPWQQLCCDKSARLRVAPVDDRGQVMLEEFEKLLGPRTRIVSIPHVSNALGTIVPVREMTEIAHRYGACVVIDGAQAVSHLPVDVQALDCDFYVFSGHKVFAPTGIGVLYGKGRVLDAMPPWQGGGNMIKDVRFEKTTYQAPPWRFEAGTGNIADAAGLGAALDYVTGLGMANIARYEHELLEYATERLLRVPGLTLIGTAPDKAGVLSFVLDGHRPEDVGAALDRDGIAVRSGHHCAQPILRRFGHEATVRASLAPYNTREDIDALTSTLLRLQAGRPARGLAGLAQ